MKIEIDNAQLIDDIVGKVVEKLKPLINNSHESKGDELMDVLHHKDRLFYLRHHFKHEMILFVFLS